MITFELSIPANQNLRITMVKKAGKEDLEILTGLAVLLWGSHSVDELSAEFSELMSEGKAQFFMKFDDGKSVGFAQCQLRHDYVEGSEQNYMLY